MDERQRGIVKCCGLDSSRVNSGGASRTVFIFSSGQPTAAGGAIEGVAK